MTYIKKEYQEILKKSDKEFIIPKSFQNFINKNILLHQLIIKNKNNIFICTNCHKEFYSKKKINEYEKCPYCKRKLLIKSNRLKNFIFKDNLQLLDKIDNVFILRTFELYSYLKDNQFEHKITEFMRTIIKENEVKDFVSNQVSNHMGYIYVSHYQHFIKWKPRDYRWSYRDTYGIVSPYNIKSLLKNTKLQYSQLNKFIAKQKYIDFIYYYKYIACQPSFEILVKLKLFNLAKDANKFNTGKTFQEVLGVPKTMYTFIKKYNLDYKELNVLKIIKVKNIKVIRGLKDCNNLTELSKYVNLEIAFNKILKENKYREYEYLDYLQICEKLKYNMKNNKILYPLDLTSEHNKVMKIFTIVKNEENNKLIKERLVILNKNQYKTKEYIIFPAQSVSSLLDESEQQNNCVKTYCEKYAKGLCDIYYMRNINTKNKSLVTIEVRNKKVVQTRIKNNELPTKKQMNIINKWESNILALT